MIKTVLLVLVSLLPGIFWVRYFYRQDKYEPEPSYLILLAFIGGISAIAPSLFLEHGFVQQFLLAAELKKNFLNLFIGSLGIGIIEEGFKLLVLYLLAFRNKEFNEPVDGIIYGVSAGLGFAVVENLFYTTRFGLMVGVVRAVIGCLAHASFSGLAGYYWASAKFSGNTDKYALSFLGPVFWHTLYNFLLFQGTALRLFLALAIIAGIISFLLNSIKEEVKRSPFRP